MLSLRCHRCYPRGKLSPRRHQNLFNNNKFKAICSLVDYNALFKNNGVPRERKPSCSKFIYILFICVPEIMMLLEDKFPSLKGFLKSLLDMLWKRRLNIVLVFLTVVMASMQTMHNSLFCRWKLNCFWKCEMEHFVTDFFRIGAMFSKVRQLTILISYNFASIASCHQNIIHWLDNLVEASLTLSEYSSVCTPRNWVLREGLLHGHLGLYGV